MSAHTKISDPARVPYEAVTRKRVLSFRLVKALRELDRLSPVCHGCARVVPGEHNVGCTLAALYHDFNAEYRR
jgi:hypothetical protein